MASLFTMKTLPLLFLMFFYSWASLVLELSQYDDEIHLNLENDIQVHSKSITFCIRFNWKGAFDKFDKVLFSSISPEKFRLQMRLRELIGFVWLDSVALVFKIPKHTLIQYSWYHFCFIADNTSYQILVEGKQLNVFLHTF